MGREEQRGSYRCADEGRGSAVDGKAHMPVHNDVGFEAPGLAGGVWRRSGREQGRRRNQENDGEVNRGLAMRKCWLVSYLVESGNIFSDDVKFQVDGAVWPEGLDVGVFESIGDDGDVEAGSFHIEDGKANAI